MTKNKLLTCPMAAEMLGLSRSHIRRLVLCGKIKAEKIGYDWFIRPIDIKKYQMQRESDNGSKG